MFTPHTSGLREVLLHWKMSHVQTEKLQWEFQLSLSARKRALKHTKNQPVYNSQRKRWLAVDLCKVTEMGSFPKVPAFTSSKPATLPVRAAWQVLGRVAGQ